MKKKSQLNEKKPFQNFLFVGSFALTQVPVKFVAFLVLSVVMVGEIIFTLKAKEFFTNAAYRLATGTSGGFKKELYTLLFLTAGLAVFYLLSIVKQLLDQAMTLGIEYHTEKKLNKKLGSIKWEYYENHKTVVAIHEVKNNVSRIITNFVKSWDVYTNAIAQVVVYAFFLSQVNIFIVFFYCGLILISQLFSGRFFNKIGGYWEEIQPHSQKQSYFFNISGDKTSHQEYRFNRLFNFIRRKWGHFFEKEYKVRLNIFKNVEIVTQVGRIIMNIPYIAMLIYIAYECVLGKHEIGFLILCFAMFNNVVNTFSIVQGEMHVNASENRFINSFRNILGWEEEPKDLSTGVINSSVSFNKVTYIYPQAEKYALKELDFSINTGEKIAVVGYNGSGKTTFTNLLMTLTDRFEGNALIDGKNYSTQYSALKNSFSSILQDFSQYQMTIRENVQIGNLDRILLDEDIYDLLEQVGLKKKVLSLSDGLETSLGQLEQGIEFSRGEWQRLAITRLLVKQDAKIWILDEPTAYLDPLSEIEIYDLIYRLSGNRTVLFISHRLGFARQADRIVVFDNGRIVEQGSHQELLSLDKIYAQMYNKQKKWYS